MQLGRLSLWGVQRVKNGSKQWTAQNLRMLPPKGSFHNNGRAILTTFSWMIMQESVFVLGDKPTKLLPKARQIDLIPNSGNSVYEKGLFNQMIELWNVGPCPNHVESPRYYWVFLCFLVSSFVLLGAEQQSYWHHWKNLNATNSFNLWPCT